jgi:hypothetical protein
VLIGLLRLTPGRLSSPEPTVHDLFENFTQTLAIEFGGARKNRNVFMAQFSINLLAPKYANQ